MEVKTINDIKVAVIVPRLDAHTARETETAINDLLRKGAKKLLCDFSQNEFISSAGLRLLLLIAQKLQSSGGELVLCSFKPFVRRVFEIAGLIQHFKICDSEEEALKSFKPMPSRG